MTAVPAPGDYGSAVTEDAWCQTTVPGNFTTWEEGNTAFDGEFDTLQMFNDRSEDDDEVESLRTPCSKPQPGGGGGKPHVAEKVARKEGVKKKKRVEKEEKKRKNSCATRSCYFHDQESVSDLDQCQQSVRGNVRG